MTDRQIETAEKELQRELAMRRHVYPRLVASGKMKPDEASGKIEQLQLAAAALRLFRNSRDTLSALGQAMINQVEVGEFTDPRGHKLETNLAWLKLRAELASMDAER